MEMKTNEGEVAAKAPATGSKPRRHFVIEHFEAEFSEWTFKEYIHMLLTMSGVHSAVQGPKPNCQVILTNFRFLQEFKAETLKEDELSSLAHIKSFEQIIQNFKIVFSEYKPVLATALSLEQLTT